MGWKFILLSTVLIISLSYANGDNTLQIGLSSTSNSVIDTAADAIATASSATGDILLSLKNVGLKSSIFLKVIVPIGSMVMKEINPEPKSLVYRELMQLKQKTENIWNTNKLDIEFSTRKLGKKIIDMEYFHNVIFPTSTMMMHTESFVDPTVFKSPTFMNSFKSGCEFGSKAPKELLKYLSLRIVKFCTDAMTKNEIILLNYKRSYLLELSGRFNVSGRGFEFPDVGKYLKKFLILFEKLGNTSALEFNEIEMMSKNFPDFDSAFDAFFTELSLKNSINIDDEEPHDLCMLHELLVHTNFNRVRAEAYAISLRDHLIDIGYIAAICSNLTFHGNEKQMTKYTTQIADEINLIAIHTFNYLCSSLANAWPNVFHQIIEEKFKSLEITSPSARVLRMLIDSALQVIGETGEKNHLSNTTLIERELELHVWKKLFLW